jgi:hypothetical protein
LRPLSTKEASEMGERLAKDVEALFKAKVEQRPEWHRMMQKRGLSAKEAPAMLAVLFGALKEAVVYVAREVDDPPRGDDA